MKLISCSACGSNDVVEDNGVFVCAFCQSRYLNDSGAASHAGPVTLEVIKTEFDVVFQDPGRNKIGVIKAVHKLNGSGLKQAKELVESTPQAVLRGLNTEAAEKAKDFLEKAGGVVSIQ